MLFEPQLAPDGPRGLGGKMAGSSMQALTGDAVKSKRRANDYYPTPPEPTRALIAAERQWLARYPTIWEPCGRGGAIARELQAAGFATIATDIVADPANDCVEADLLATRESLSPAAVSNLPFALARRMVSHLWGLLSLEYMALLFKAQFLNSGASAALWREGFAPTRRWDMTWRVDFTGNGQSTMDTCWLVWDRVDTAQRFGLLDREGPVRETEARLF